MTAPLEILFLKRDFVDTDSDYWVIVYGSRLFANPNPF
jgi:hypothetical protein